MLTDKKIYDNISELLLERFKKATKNNLKKLLTDSQHGGKISELLDKSNDEENQSTLTNKQ